MNIAKVRSVDYDLLPVKTVHGESLHLVQANDDYMCIAWHCAFTKLFTHTFAETCNKLTRSKEFKSQQSGTDLIVISSIQSTRCF